MDLSGSLQKQEYYQEYYQVSVSAREDLLRNLLILPMVNTFHSITRLMFPAHCRANLQDGLFLKRINH